MIHRYKVITVTGDDPNAATDAGIFFTLYGTKGNTAEIQHDTLENNHERKGTDTFTFDHEDLGEIQRVYMRNDGNQPDDGRSHGPGWQLIDVFVEDWTEHKKWQCSFNSWLVNSQPHKLDATLNAVPVAFEAPVS
jgi:hypothetical protein